jgi:AhpC/TSA family
MTRSKSDIVFVLLLLAGSVTLNLWLARGHRADAVAAPAPPSPVSIVGRAIKSLEVHSIDGEPVTVDLAGAGQPTVIYVIRPTCEWCGRNTNNIRRVFDSAKDRFRFIGLSLDKEGLRAYLQTSPLPFPVYVAPSSATVSTLNTLYVTPQTFVVSAGGMIEKVWDGAYIASLGSEIQDFFHMSLPGIVISHPNGAFSGCRDEFGGEYSLNAVQRFKDGFKQCAPDGTWKPVTIGRVAPQ